MIHESSHYGCMDNVGWREDYGKMGGKPWPARD